MSPDIAQCPLRGNHPLWESLFQGHPYSGKVEWGFTWWTCTRWLLAGGQGYIGTAYLFTRSVLRAALWRGSFHHPHVVDRDPRHREIQELDWGHTAKVAVWTQSKNFQGSGVQPSGHTASGHVKPGFLSHGGLSHCHLGNIPQAFGEFFIPLVILVTYLDILRLPSDSLSCFTSPLNQSHILFVRGSLEMQCVFF